MKLLPKIVEETPIEYAVPAPAAVEPPILGPTIQQGEAIFSPEARPQHVTSPRR